MNFVEALGKKYRAWTLRNSYDWVNTDHSPKVGKKLSPYEPTVGEWLTYFEYFEKKKKKKKKKNGISCCFTRRE